MNSGKRLGLCLAAVCLLYAVHVHLKTAKIFANPTWDAQDEVGQFWSECAFQYRFAKFFATHPVSDWGQLRHDRNVQYPDAIDDWAEFTVAMEAPVGVLYRWLELGSPLPATRGEGQGEGNPAASPHPVPLPGGEGAHAWIPFHVFVVWYACLVSSLSLFAVFFLARALWRSDGSGLFASALYAALYPSYGRTVKNLFLREDFAIPLIIFALFFTVRALQDQKKRHQIPAALFWLAALASWHLTQFVMAPFVVAAVLVYLGRGETPRRPWFVLTLAAGSVLVPVLRAKQLFLSPTMCVLYALTLAVWIDGGRKRATIIFAGWAAVWLTLSWLLQKSYGEYAHVYQLFFYKLRFLGQRPDNPAMLPWEARVLWEGGAFNTAEWGEFWRSLKWCGPLGLVAAIRLASRKTDACATNIFIVFTLLLAPLAWMVLRYFTFLGFAAAVLAAGLMAGSIRWKLAIFAAVAWQLMTLNFQPLDRQQPAPAEYRPIVRWLQEHTPTNAVLLAAISESPVFLAHTERPIIMHSKFENARIRERYREMLEAMYGSEEQFYAFARKYGADYFVYDVGFTHGGLESRRYKADKLGPLDPNCAAMLFENQPERLTHFQRVAEGGRFTVFRVLPSP